MKFLGALISVLLLTGCSIYESQGRKFLESQALEYAGVSAQDNLQSCDHEQTAAPWVLLQRDENAEVLALDGAGYEMRVVPNEDPTFACQFRFVSSAG